MKRPIFSKPKPIRAKSLAITAMTKALNNSKYEQNYDKAIEMLVAIDKAGLKFIKKPLRRVKPASF